LHEGHALTLSKGGGKVQQFVAQPARFVAGFALCAPSAFPATSVRRRIVCENVESIPARDEATEHSARVSFKYCCPLQP